MTAKQTHKSLLQRVLSCVMAFAMILTLLPVTALAEGEAAYYVAGDKALCGVDWSPDAAENQMEHKGDGTYVKVYPNVAAGTYNLKVTDGTWDHSWGDNGSNYTFVVTSECAVTVTFDSNTETVSVTGENVTKKTSLNVERIVAVGNGDGSWLNGVAWDPASDDNKLTEVSEGVYEITYMGIPAGPSYQVKFAANGSWADNWGGTYTGSGVETDAVYNADGNITFAIDYAAADVTLKLDLTGFDYSTKSGAKFTITIAEAEAPVVVDYYLFGYINGANYGCEEDYETMGDYKFVNGKLTAQFDGTSYVAVKTTGNADWYMTDDWQGEVTEVTLYNTKDLGDTANKLMVPGGVEVTFTLVENPDGTLTLSYAETSGMNKVTIHYLKPADWGSTINAYVWAASGGAVPGYEDYNSWPGKAVSENASHEGWYDLVVATEQPTAFNFIFNDGGNQTDDLSTGEITGNTELWVVGNEVLTTAPGEWSGTYTYTANIHFQKPESWGSTVNAWIWGKDGETIEGYEAYHTNWPGAPIDPDSVNAGWYNVSVTMATDEGFNFILNDGTNKTSDLSTGKLQVKTDIWVVGGEVLTEAPDGWMDPNRTIHIPGTFPGPSWDPGSNQMTYDPELDLYVYTFQNVPAANYEYKIAVNKSWSENYGLGGEPGGSNIPVAVPTAQDVTIWYSDKTHNSANSIDYVFANINLKGTGIPEGTKLTDPGLSGIYSATVSLTAGTHDDIVLAYDGEEYPFVAFELTEDKDVTFFFDPTTGIYYHNGSDAKVGVDAIYYNSKDKAYKSPFGAVAVGEDVTFSITTGDDVVDVKLVVKGVDSFQMSEPEAVAYELGTKIWTCTVQFENIGEFDYYFAISNGSDVVIYGDDDGNYGEGTASDLASVLPYDLVVYQSGFETPDWMKDAVIYQIFPDRFFDGDSSNNLAQTTARGAVDYEYISDWYTLPENPEQEALLDEETYKATGAYYGDGEWSNEIYGGDLKGITERIDYLKALGVNVIYLNPVFWSISNHRYDACDYTKIDPILGTLGDFEELVAIAEANGMHIILDGVFNHVSDDSVYFDRYYKFLGTSERIGAYPYWAYVYDYMAENGVTQADAETAARTYFTEEYGITDYAYTEWFAVSSKTMDGTVDTIGLRAGKEVYSYEGWWGYDSMPVIYSTNGSEYQTGNWAQEIIGNAEGTSVTQYWLSKGSNGWRLDVANEVSDETWQNFRASVKALDSDAVIVGEIWDDATKYLKGDMYDSVMNYVFRNAVTGFAKGGSAEEAMNTLERIRERYPEEAFYAMMNLVGSHDTTRLLSYLDGIADDRSDKSVAAAFPTYEGTSDTAKARQHLVAFLQFTYPGAPTIYYGDEIGMVGSDDPDDRRAMEWGKGSQELVEWYASLAAIRKAYPALRTGELEVIETGSQNLLGFTRSLDGQTLIVVANNSSDAQIYTPVDPAYISYTDLISGKEYAATDVRFTVPACSGIILVPTSQLESVKVNYSGLAPAYDPSYIVGERDVTPPHDHSYTESVVEPTCEEPGYTEYVCDCGYSYKDQFVNATGHSYSAVVTEPTCNEQGFTTYTCEFCGHSYKADFVDANGHQYVEEKTEATCTEGGVTKLVCTVCGECIISSEEEALGHDMVDKVIREGTCTRSGIVIHQCSRCGQRETEIVPASGHDYKTVTDSHGHTKQVCTVCGHTKNSFDKFFSWISGFFPRPY